jgi:hypothetical protein
MVCKITSTKRAQGGFTFVEFIVASGIGLIAMAALGMLILHTGRSFAAMANYVDLDSNSRHALDTMTRDIRQSESLTAFSATQLTFNYTNGVPLVYTYSPGARTLTRTFQNQSEVLLTECDELQFSIYQRNPVGGSYDQHPTASYATCKLVQLNWICSRTILGARMNTESVQSAKIVLRRQ